jgi:hypothetical protein
MHGVGIRGRMHGHRRDAELLARAQHAQRDLAAIGYKDFVEHARGPAWSSPTHKGAGRR